MACKSVLVNNSVPSKDLNDAIYVDKTDYRFLE